MILIYVIFSIWLGNAPLWKTLGIEFASIAPEETGDKSSNPSFDGMVSAVEVASTSVYRNLRELQRVGENCGEIVPTTVFEVTGLAREIIETKRNIATLSDSNKDIEAKLAVARTVRGTMREQLVGAER